MKQLFEKIRFTPAVKKNFLDWLKAIIIALLVLLFVGLFLFESYTIPTSSMEKTLINGDYILVSKVSYGARMPMTPLTFPFLSKIYTTIIQLPYIRIPGFSDIKKNDVIVFNYPVEDERPVDKRIPFVKRCVALPGDTFQIINGKVFVNSILLSEPENAEFNFLVRTDNTVLDQDTLDKLGITEGGPVNDLSTYNLTMTRKNAALLSKMHHVFKTGIMCEDSGMYAENLFPSSMFYSWNMDNYGPLVIPAKGVTVKLNKKTIPLYYRIISVYEKNKLTITNDSICTINDTLSKTYTFKMNYFFTLGDNRHNSADSRCWGFVPEDHIIGKAVMILFSTDRSKGFFNRIRWVRCLRMIE